MRREILRGAPRSLALGAALIMIGLAGVVAAQDELCLDCHAAAADPELAAEGYGVDAAAWNASIHAESGFGCADCHEGTDDYPHEVTAPALCADCHDDAAEDFARGVHGESHERNGEDEAWPAGEPCSVCHGVHDARAAADPESRVHYRNIAATCGECHGDLAIVQEYGLSTAPFDNYQKSVHGRTNGDSEKHAAVCTDCHRAHLVLRANDPESLINPFRIPATCGTCHDEVSEQYLGSVHGTAFEHGVSASPTCTDCHGIHSIKIVAEEGATPLEERLVRSTCVTCHSSEALMSEYGVAVSRVATYQATYHGLAAKRGTAAVADCASCHGIHAIYPSSDPRSSIAPANLEATCGHCHPGAGEQFARNPVHFVAGEGDPGTVVASWVRSFYLSLIAVVIGGMLIHNGIILRFHLRRRIRQERGAASRRRFSPSQVAQHSVLLVSFIVLAVTGFVLAYPDMWGSRLLEVLGLTEGARRWVHRIAGVVLMSAAAYHVAWLWTSYGRQELRRILPRLADLREIADNLLFHLGRRDKPAAAGKFDYPAKLEYWSMVWGTAIMAVTGIILWFPVWATTFLPFWAVKVSEVIHLFEAWLATLAILVFHFFYVFGHPDVYPLSFSMLHGRMTKREARHRHPEWGDQEAVSPPRRRR